MGTARRIPRTASPERPTSLPIAAAWITTSYPMFSFTFSTNPFSENGFARKS